MKIVQIKGPNGSGKSTIVRQLVAMSKDAKYLESHKITILDDLGWVLVGPYLDRGPTSNGCDNIGKVADVKQAILNAIFARPHFNVLFEGMMISTIKSTFYDYLLELQSTRKSPHITPLFVILQADPDKCIERLGKRGTRKSNLKRDNIVAKCEMVVRHAKTYNPRHVCWIDVDLTPEDRMLSSFLYVIGEDGPFTQLDDEYAGVKEIDMEPLEYMNIVDLSVKDLDEELWNCGIELDADANQLQKRRILAREVLDPVGIDRSEIIPENGVEPHLFAPWCVRDTDFPPVWDRDVGYISSSKHAMTLQVAVHQIPRDDVPLLTEWEQVTMCRDCKGAGGSCPGLSPRMDYMAVECDWMYVVTVSADYCWAMEYGSTKSWYMLSGYTDMITISYMNRLVDRIAETFSLDREHLLGAHNCPGKCKDCVALRSGKCGRKKRRFSMEAVGIDCDALHLMLYDEWMPWAYKGHDFAPTYMTRYAGWMAESAIHTSNLCELMDGLVEKDKTYIPTPSSDWIDEMYDKHNRILDVAEIPAGVHKGCRMHVYDLSKIKNRSKK